MGRMQLYPLKRHGVCRKHGDRRSRNGYHTGKTLHLGQSGFRLSGRMESAVPKRFPNLFATLGCPAYHPGYETSVICPGLGWKGNGNTLAKALKLPLA